MHIHHRDARRAVSQQIKEVVLRVVVVVADLLNGDVLCSSNILRLFLYPKVALQSYLCAHQIST